MRVVDLVRKYQARIEEIDAEVTDTLSYGGPIVGLERLNRIRHEAEVLREVVADLGQL